MTFWTTEQSIESSTPVEIIDFACGATHWRQTSSTLAVTYGGQTYSPQAGLSIGDIEDSGNVLRTTCDIAADWANPLVLLYPGTPPDAVITVTIYRLQGATSSLWWKGYVADIRRESGRKATIKCVSSLSALGVGSLCLRSGRSCQVPLYCALCGVIQAAFTETGVVLSVQGCDITAAVFDGHDDGYWVGGPITINGYSRIVLDHNDDVVTISQSIPGIAAGQTVTISAGCDHLMPTCEETFDNLDNFKGYPNLPIAKNPFVQGVS